MINYLGQTWLRCDLCRRCVSCDLMRFYKLENAIDGELELVRPAARYIDAMLAACQHPLGWGDKQSAWTRQQLVDFISRHPDGIDHGDEIVGRSHGYYFWMQLNGGRQSLTDRALGKSFPPVPMAGTLSLRLADTEQINLYAGHIGYGVFQPARGYHYAERAVRLIIPLAKAHGMDHLIITCNPDNLPSRRTCERLGAQLLGTIDIPESNTLYARGERQKCRYRLTL